MALDWRAFISRPHIAKLPMNEQLRLFNIERARIYNQRRQQQFLIKEQLANYSEPAVSSGAAGDEGPSSQSFLLDQFSDGIVAAYSLRRLSSTYTGSLIQVQTGSTDPKLDVGYDENGYLDTESIKAWNTSNEMVLLENWFDQSGNGFDANQNSNNRRLQLTDSSGNFFTASNGQVRLYINENSRGSQWVAGLGEQNVFPASGSMSIIGCYYNDQTTYQNYEIVYSRDTDSNYPIQLRSDLGSGYIENVQSQGAGLPPENVMNSGTVRIQTSSINQLSFIANQNPGTTSIYSNTELVETSTTFTIPTLDRFFFPDPQGTALASEPMEWLLYNEDKSADREAIETSLNNFYNFIHE